MEGGLKDEVLWFEFDDFDSDMNQTELLTITSQVMELPPPEGVMAIWSVPNGIRIMYSCGTVRFIGFSWFDDARAVQNLVIR